MNIDGVKVFTKINAMGETEVYLSSPKALKVYVDGRRMEPSQQTSKQLFWTPDGKQTAEGTVDLRGEVPQANW